MYQDFFNFTEAPFAIVPNTKFFFLSERHKEALSHMLTGISGGGGMALLTGEVGTGKTMTMRALLARLPTQSQVLTIVNPSLTELELLQTICDGFELEYASDDSFKTLLDKITTRLYDNEAQGIDSILLVDEAQHLQPEVLELLRLLTNIETTKYKLLKVILIGQPELHQVLRRESLRQLAQRITERYQLMPLPNDELKQYILHRLTCVGRLEPLFNDGCYQIISDYTGGVPRLINLVCDHALKVAFREGKRYIDTDMAKQACHHVLDWQMPAVASPIKKLTRYNPYYVGAIGALGLIFVVSALSILARSIFHAAPVTEIELAKDGKPRVIQPQKNLSQVKSAVATDESLEPIPIARVDTISSTSLFTQGLSMGSAVQQLYQAWGYQADEFASSCRSETRANLSCYRAMMQLDQVLNINRPAVMVMNGVDGRLWYARLLASSAEQIEILVGQNNNPMLMSRAIFEQHWSGEVLLLWRPPLANTGMLAMGQRNNRVRWLDERLNMALGEFSEASNHFNQALRNKVMAFQIQQNIDADGIAGPLTIMMLDGVLSLAGPTLKVSQAANVAEKAILNSGKIVKRKAAFTPELALRRLPDFATPITSPPAKKVNKANSASATLEAKKLVKPVAIKTKDPVGIALGNEVVDINKLDFSELSPTLAKQVENALIQVAKTPDKEKQQQSNQTSKTYSNVIDIAELPTPIKARMPSMNFQAHVYASDPSNRWVKVNNRNITEGQRIAGTVLLRGVEPNQVVVQFEGKLIAIPALTTW